MSTSGKHVMFFFRSMSPNSATPPLKLTARPQKLWFKTIGISKLPGAPIFKGKLAVSFREGFIKSMLCFQLGWFFWDTWKEDAFPGLVTSHPGPWWKNWRPWSEPVVGWMGWNHQTPMELVDGFGWIHMDITWRVGSFKISPQVSASSSYCCYLRLSKDWN